MPAATYVMLSLRKLIFDLGFYGGEAYAVDKLFNPLQ